jgi:hypothetical protein
MRSVVDLFNVVGMQDVLQREAQWTASTTAPA